MAKRKMEKPRREFTKRQLSRWQQQLRRQRIVLGIGVFIIVGVLGTIGVGWCIKEYRPLHQIVIRVNDAEFDMGYYVDTLKLYAEGRSAQSISFLGNQVEENIKQGELIRQAVAKLEITVSDDELDEELRSHDPPFNDAHKDILRTQMLIEKLRDDYFGEQVPTFAEQRRIIAMFLESENQVSEVRTRLDNGEDFAELAGELSLDDFTKTTEGDPGWQLEGVLSEMSGSKILEEHVFDGEIGVFSQAIHDEDKAKIVGYWLVEILKKKEEAEVVDARAILLGNADEAQDVKARLEAGEDFSELAEELSQDDASKDKGGALGWLSAGMMPALDDFIFNVDVEPGIINEPIRDEAVVTIGGYWLFKVVEIDDNREVENEDRDLLKSKALSEWLSSLEDDAGNKVESFLDEEKQEWAISRLPRPQS